MIELNLLCEKLGITCDYNIEITGLNTLIDANEHEISFLENKKYIKDLELTKAGAVLISSDLASLVPTNSTALVCKNPYLYLAKASYYFKRDFIIQNKNNSNISKTANIMQNVSIGDNVNIGENTIIMPGCFIGNNAKIGSNTILHANVSIYHDCKIGNDVIIHSGTSIGSDGFGFTPDEDGKYIKIYQNGNVVIHDNVEIGSNCTIDRAAFNSTIIQSNVRLDNLVHIAHNCIIKHGCVLTGQTGVAGSSTLNEYVVMGGQSGIAGHIEIAAFTTISARALAIKDIKESKKQWTGFPMMEHKTWMRLQAKISKLLK